jgi:predicted nucleic acid-binding Zn ribbon protein
MTKPHRHCAVCSTPIPLEERTCSDKCQKILVENQKKVKKTKTILYIVFGAFILVWLGLTLLGKM